MKKSVTQWSVRLHTYSGRGGGDGGGGGVGGGGRAAVRDAPGTVYR